tara:strand:+ start:253 stop:594 length:342 start_codon:yes stop_codon:yes gene_type:complete
MNNHQKITFLRYGATLDGDFKDVVRSVLSGGEKLTDDNIERVYTQVIDIVSPRTMYLIKLLRPLTKEDVGTSRRSKIEFVYPFLLDASEKPTANKWLIDNNLEPIEAAEQTSE